jgi:hypothetical protein
MLACNWSLTKHHQAQVLHACAIISRCVHFTDATIADTVLQFLTCILHHNAAQVDLHMRVTAAESAAMRATFGDKLPCRVLLLKLLQAERAHAAVTAAAAAARAVAEAEKAAQEAAAAFAAGASLEQQLQENATQQQLPLRSLKRAAAAVKLASTLARVRATTTHAFSHTHAD